MEAKKTRHNCRHERNSFGRTHAADDVVVPQPELAVRQSTELVGEILLVEAALEVDQTVLALRARETNTWQTLVRHLCVVEEGAGGINWVM